MWPFIAVLVVAIVATYLMMPKPENQPAAGLSEIKAPTAEDGREIPVLFGVKLIESPNIVWYGDMRTDAIKKKGQVIGHFYWLGMHMVICHGPIDSVESIVVGKKEVYGLTLGDEWVYIDNEDIFGGPQKEGGIRGYVRIEQGTSSQMPNAYLQTQYGSDMPAFRGVVGIVADQIYVGTSQYIKPWAFRAKRISAGWEGAQWYPTKANITGIPEIVRESMIAGALAGGAYSAVVPYITDIASPTYDRYYAEYGVAGMPISIGITLGSALVGGTPITVPIDVTTDHKIWAYNGARAADGILYQFEFLDAGNNVIAAIQSFDPEPHPQGHIMAYGPSLADYTLAGIPATEFGSYTDGTIRFLSGELRFDRNELNNNNKLSWTFACDALSITQLRVSQLVAGRGGSLSDGFTVCGLIFHEVLDYTAPQQFDSLNPAHIIYEALTNTQWGMGYPAADLDDTTFTAAADTLHVEGMGMNILWDRQMPIEDFLAEIVRHIDGSLYVDRVSGKFSLKLLRDDYSLGALPTFTEAEILKVTDASRPTISELINSVSVVYSDDLTAEDAGLTVQDQALIQQHGSVVATTRQYPGFSNYDIAARVALRDLKALSTPLLRVSIEVNRINSTLNIGDPFLLTWPDLAINGVVMRVQKLQLGDVSSQTIKIDAIEDAFSTPTTGTVSKQTSEWVDVAVGPAAADYRKIEEAPYWDIYNRLSAADLSVLPDTAGFMQAIVAKPSSASIEYELYSRTGADSFADVDTNVFSPFAKLTAAIGKTTTAITFDSAIDTILVSAGSYALLDDEYVGVTAIDYSAGTATITRGLMDTVPASHADNAIIWFCEDYKGEDATEYTLADVVDAKALPTTGQGTLDINLAPTDSVTMAQRWIKPYPPAGVTVGGAAFPESIAGDDALVLDWTHRDRLAQTTLLDTLAATVGPEAGTTYTIRLYGEGDVLLRTITGETGTTYTYDLADESSDLLGWPNDTLRFEIESVRDGFTSTYHHDHTVRRREGYGLHYGTAYGGEV